MIRFARQSILGLGFLGFGLAFGAIAVGILLDNHRRAATAARAEGEVTRLEWRLSEGDRGRPSRVAYPWVRLRAEGREVEFPGEIGSSPPAYAVGQKVAVLYPPGRPEDGWIDGVWERFLFPAVFGLFGLAFGGIGGCLLIADVRKAKARRRALASGTPVEATVIDVRYDTSMQVNGRSPWVLVAEFRDPGSGRTHTFTSPRLWDNPEPEYPVGGTATVYYLPEDPSIYAFQLDRPHALV